MSYCQYINSYGIAEGLTCFPIFKHKKREKYVVNKVRTKREKHLQKSTSEYICTTKSKKVMSKSISILSNKEKRMNKMNGQCSKRWIGGRNGQANMQKQINQFKCFVR